MHFTLGDILAGCRTNFSSIECESTKVAHEICKQKCLVGEKYLTNSGLTLQELDEINDEPKQLDWCETTS